MATKKPRPETREEKLAREIFFKLMPGWEGRMMLFTGAPKMVVIQGGILYRYILKAVKQASL